LRGNERSSSQRKILLATRCASEFCPRIQTPSPPGLTRWSMLRRGFQSLSINPIKLLVRMDCRIKSGNDQRKRKRNAGRRVSNLRILRCGAHQRVRSPVGVPPRLLGGEPTPLSVPCALPGTWLRNGCYPLPPVPVQRHSRRPVMVPAGRFPGAARERSANPRAVLQTAMPGGDAR
jgi:hypothetical protein